MKKPSKHIYILTALSTTRFNKEFKQVLPYQPTSGKTWPTSSTVRVSFSMLENRTGSMQEQTWGQFHCTSCCWYSVWLCGVGGVGGEVSEETIQTYLYSNCAFHHQI